MMRKVIWCGTALLVCGTFAATMAAYYVAENPDSAFSQATVAAYDVCSWFNPALTVSRMSAVPVVCADKPCPEAVAWMPHPEMPDEPQEPPMPEVGELPQIAEPIIVEEITPPVIQETQEPAIEGGQLVPFMDPSHETGMDDVPAFMPYADDDEAVLNQAQTDKPDFMTQLLGCFMNQEGAAEELGCAAFAEAVAEFLKDLVGEDSDTTVVPTLPDEPVQDNAWPESPVEGNGLTPSEPAQNIPPTSTVEQPMPEVQAVDSATGAAVGAVQATEPPPLPENQGTGTAGTGVGAAIGEVLTTPERPVGVEYPGTGTQDSNPPNPQNTNMQEDPSYHHQYPSCPYTGQCPYTGHCPYPYHYNVPSVPYTEPASQPTEITKPRKPTKPKPTKPAKPVEKKDPMIDLETFGVDTMECRPSDVTSFLPGAGPF